MSFVEIKQKYSKGINVYGANLGNVQNAQFHMLSEAKHKRDYSPEQIEIIKKFEERLDELYERVAFGYENEDEISPMEIVDGKVVLKNGQVYHKCRPSMENLENISIGGVLASEWFGEPESENEGALCAFANKRFTSESEIVNNRNKFLSQPNISRCIIYFDEKNPLMQKLIDIDFFEYEHLKNTNPEKINELYPEVIRELYDEVIEPFSQAGKHFHDSTTKMTYGWLAIPGGIPAGLVNGISISHECEDLIYQVEEIRRLYPNAVIFDENQNILAEPLRQAPAHEVKENEVKEESI